MGMTFGASRYLAMSVVFMCFFIFVWFFQTKRQKMLFSWIKPEHWGSIIPDFSQKKFSLKWWFFNIGMAFVLISLLRPQWGEHEEIIENKGMDILFVLDLSNSMLAEDVNPSRLARSQSFVKKTLTQLSDDRVGLIGFAGRAFLAIPLTTDFDYVGEVVDSLSPSVISEQGTEIGEAIDVAIKAFERGGTDTRKTSRAIVLISDGEDFGKNPTDVAAKIKGFESGFFAFSVGTPDGGPIPVRTDNGILQNYKKDRSGKTIISRTNPDLLSKIASAGGGKFFEISNADDAAYILTKQLSAFHKDSTKEQRKVTKIERFQYFLGLGIALLILSLTLSYQPLFRKITLFLFLFLIVNPNYAKSQTWDGYWKNKQGNGLYSKKQFEDSAKQFETARNHNQDNPIMEFNQATALAKSKKDEDAVFHFEETTKKALNQGDFETAAKSMYNEGILHKQNQNYDESLHNLTNAIEMAKISNQPELEKKARMALLKAAQEQQQQKNQQQSRSDKEKKEQKEKDKQKSKSEQQDQNDNKSQSPSKEVQEQKREFKSGTLSKDVAESIMNDLSDREKQLYQKKIKERKNKEIQNEKDW